jgi:hypothetical protein
VVFPVYVVFPAGNATFPVFGLSFGLLAIWHVLLLAFWPFWHALHLAFLRLSGLALGSPVLWRLDMTSLCQHFFRLSGLLQAFWPTSGFLACFRFSGLLQAFWLTPGFLTFFRLSGLLHAFGHASLLASRPSGMPRFWSLLGF